MGFTYHHECFVHSNYYYFLFVFHLEHNMCGIIKRSLGWGEHALSMFCQQINFFHIKQSCCLTGHVVQVTIFKKSFFFSGKRTVGFALCYPIQ